jgi:hypothetical protein
MNNSIEISADKKYEWNQSWANPLAHTDINLVIAELKDIEDARGCITPELVVESSKNKRSVLHNYFVWDDTKAANAYRLMQATHLLRRIEVKVINDGEPTQIRAYEFRTKTEQSTGTYINHDMLSESDIERTKKFLITDLVRVSKRLSGFNRYQTAVEYIDMAIEILKGEETTPMSLIEDKEVAVF